MSIELGKKLKENPIQKLNRAKIKIKLSNVNKEPLARKRIFVQKPFSHSTSKLEFREIPVAERNPHGKKTHFNLDRK